MSFIPTYIVTENKSHFCHRITVLKFKATVVPLKNKTWQYDKNYEDMEFFFNKTPLGVNFLVNSKFCNSKLASVHYLDKTCIEYYTISLSLNELLNTIGLNDNCNMCLSNDDYLLYKRLFLNNDINDETSTIKTAENESPIILNNNDHSPRCSIQ